MRRSLDEMEEEDEGITKSTRGSPAGMDEEGIMLKLYFSKKMRRFHGGLKLPLLPSSLQHCMDR